MNDGKQERCSSQAFVRRHAGRYATNPQLGIARLTLESATRARRATDTVARRGLLTIPIIVHVVYKTDEENISDSQIQSQIDSLNHDFRATNLDLDRVPAVWRVLST